MRQLHERVKEILSSEDKFCTKHFWVNKDGNVCNLKDACRFCLLGAVEKAKMELKVPTLEYLNLLKDEIKKGPWTYNEDIVISSFNDNVGYPGVKKLLDEMPENFVF